MPLESPARVVSLPTAATLAAAACAILTGCAAPDLPSAPDRARGAVASADVRPYSAVRAAEWETLFDRRSGWTGADGNYSIPLSGNDQPASGGGGGGRTLWVFDDTFIGDVGEDDRRINSVLVNNTFGVLEGGAPDTSRMGFFWRTAGAGAAAAQVTPNTSPGHWFWPSDGVVVDGTVFLFTLRMKPGGSGAFAFATDGVSLLTASAAAPVPFQTYTQTVAPLYVGGASETYFGAAVMANTTAAGAPRPDGYVYVYGTRNDAYNKKVVVARVTPQSIARFSDYRFWDGRRWNASIGKAAPLADRASSEFSVTPLDDGRYLMVFQLDALGRDVAVRYGTSPTGPFGPAIPVWRAPEPDLDPDVYVYGAKAHPHLSAPGELLISYNVNTFDFNDHLLHADIYRARFIRLPLN